MKSTDVYTYCSPLLTQLRYFLFGLAHTRRNNSTVCACGRTGERPGDCHVAPIHPNTGHLGSEGSEHSCRMLFQHCRALPGTPQVTASLLPSLFNNTTSCSRVAHVAVFHNAPQVTSQKQAASTAGSFSCPPASCACTALSQAQVWSQLFGQPVRGSFQCVCIFLVAITMVSQ